MKYMIFKTVR